MSSLYTFTMPAACPNNVQGLLPDQSVCVLNEIFGNVVSRIADPTAVAAQGGSQTLFTSMLSHFNSLLLGSGLLIFAITLFIGTMQSAHEGKFLGKNWHSLWTPLRLVGGLTSIVPLKSGLCIGQHIMMYAILLGVNLGTSLWQFVVGQVFFNHVAPPIPSYISTAAMQAVNQDFVMQSVVGIIQNHETHDTSGNVTVSTGPATYNIADLVSSSSGSVYEGGNASTQSATPVFPPELQQAIQDRFNDICNHLDPQEASSCSEEANSWLMSAGQSSQPGNAGAATGMNFYLGDAFPDASEMPAAGSSFTGYTQPGNGNVDVQNVTYTYSFPSSSTTPTPPDPCGASGVALSPAQAGACMQAEVGAFVGSTVVAQTSNVLTCAPGSDNSGPSCDLSPIVGVLNQGAAAYAAAAPAVPSTGLSGATLTGMTGVTNSDPYGNWKAMCVPTNSVMQPTTPGVGNVCPENTVLEYQPAHDVDVNGTNEVTFYVPNVGVAQNPNEPPLAIYLTNSWWVAGESYMIMDQQLASNLSAFATYFEDLNQYVPAIQALSSTMTFDTVLGVSESPSLGPIGVTPPTGSSVQGGSCQPYNYGTPVMQGCLAGSTSCDLAQGTSTPPAANTVFDNGVSQNSNQEISDGSAAATNVSNLFPGKSVNSFLVAPLFYSCAVGQVFASVPLATTLTVHPTAMSFAPSASSWTTFLNTWLQVGTTTPPNCLNVSSSDTTALAYCRMKNLPTSDQMPFYIIYKVLSSDGSPGSVYFDKSAPGYVDPTLQTQMLNMLTVMLYNDNNLLSQNTSGTLPIQRVMNDIFNNLLGFKNMPYAAGSVSGNAPAISNNIQSIMQEVYNLGEPPKGIGMVAGQFSQIQAAQSAGIDMITTVLTSIEAVYGNMNQEMVNVENGIYSTAQTNLIIGSTLEGAGFLAAGGALYASADPVGNLTAGLSAVSNMFMGAASITMQVLQLQMQWNMVQVMVSIGQSLMWLPIAFLVFSALFAAGMSFALLVPLMPYILFWAGSIAWLLAVLEAMVATPLVMLGFAHPGGHEVMGHTVPAVKMLLGVIFRPVLMIFGMLAGILLTYIVIQYSAIGFHVVASSIINAVADQTTQGILACIMLVVYCGFMVMAFSKCFSAIYTIPEKVMQWIDARSAGDRAGAEDLQQITQKVDSTSQQVTQAGQSATSSGLETQKQAASSSGSAGGQESGLAASAGGATQAITSAAQSNKLAQQNKTPDASSTPAANIHNG